MKKKDIDSRRNFLKSVGLLSTAPLFTAVNSMADTLKSAETKKPKVYKDKIEISPYWQEKIDEYLNSY